MGSQLCGRAARGDHLIQLKRPLDSIGRAEAKAARRRRARTHGRPSARRGDGFVVTAPGFHWMQDKRRV